MRSFVAGGLDVVRSSLHPRLCVWVRVHVWLPRQPASLFLCARVCVEPGALGPNIWTWVSWVCCVCVVFAVYGAECSGYGIYYGGEPDVSTTYSYSSSNTYVYRSVRLRVQHNLSLVLGVVPSRVLLVVSRVVLSVQRRHVQGRQHPNDRTQVPPGQQDYDGP